ncbi:PLANT HOMOLOGOUS TO PARAFIBROMIN [Wolffia australiana]
MDPLLALRDFAIRGDLDKIVRVGDEFRFGADYSFPSSAETAYRSKQGNLYTLETLIYYLQHHQLKHTDYLQSARLNRIPTVTLPDRKPLLDYLLGRVASSDSIEFLHSDDHRPEDLASVRPDSSVSAEIAVKDLAVAADPCDTDFVSLIRALERPLKDRDSILECRNRDFHSILLASTKREEDRQRIESQQRKDGLVAKTRLIGSEDGDHLHEAVQRPKMHIKGVPIILVPSAFQTLITIYNVKEFLEDGVFVPSEVKVRGGMAKPECVTVQKKLSRDRVMAAYEVRDKPSALKSEDWDRVVCVFVLGKEWQFKDWPFKDHVEIFNKIIGFFVRFEDDSVESAKMVKQWNVKIISISKNKRHQDRAAALEVWDRLEAFMRSRAHA